MARTMAAWLPVLAFLALVAAPGGGNAASNCSASFTATTCPNPPTVKGFDLSAYVGKWYEIGSTARFKLGTESGLVCVFANYTLAEAPTPTQGANVTVVNSGFQVLGPIASQGVAVIQASLQELCSAARALCSAVGPAGPISQAVAQVKGVSAGLSGEDAQTLASAVANISNALASLQDLASPLSGKVKAATIQAGALSQAIGSKAGNLKQFSDIAKGLETGVFKTLKTVGKISSARGQIISVANKLLAGSPSNAQVAFLLTLAGTQIWAQEEVISLQNVEIALGSQKLLEVAEKLVAADSSSPSRRSALTGFAEQSVSDPAKLNVFFPIPGVPLTSGPYWVVAITGEASQGYEAAVVFSCTQLSEGEVDTGLFILSRTSTLSPDVTNSLLAKAEEFGFSFSCDNPFLFTVQDHPNCQN